MIPTRLRAGALAAAGCTLALLPLASAPTAMAAPPPPEAPAAPAAPAAEPTDSSPTFAHGRVVAAGGVTARSLPTTRSADYGSYPKGHRLTLICKVRGTAVGGNRLWYLVPAEGWEFVSARWVGNLGAAPGYCGSAHDATGRATATLRLRVAPTTALASAGTVHVGARVALRCAIDGPSVAGNHRWYYTTGHRWVSARYVHNTGPAPTPCYPPWAG